MIRFRKLLPLAAVLAGAVVLGTPRAAHAYIEVDYSVDGSARTFGNSSNTGTVFFGGDLLGVYNVALNFSTTNTPGNNALALVTSSNNTVTTDTGVSGTHTLTIYVTSLDFTNPTSPPPTVLGTASSGTTAAGSGKVTVTYAGYADATNTKFGTQVAAGPGSYDIVATGGQGGNGGGPALTNSFSPNGAKYSLTDVLKIQTTDSVNITNVTGNVNVTPTPAPAGAVLALSGLPFVGLGAWLRRRKQA
jgi:hypothetical protein